MYKSANRDMFQITSLPLQHRPFTFLFFRRKARPETDVQSSTWELSPARDASCAQVLASSNDPGLRDETRKKRSLVGLFIFIARTWRLDSTVCT
jgi:hypothetical protein